MTYGAGCVIVREVAHHRVAFTDRADYLRPARQSLAAGNPWPVEFGPVFSCRFCALKVWSQIAGIRTQRLGAAIARTCAQAAYLAEKVGADPRVELMEPVALDICCFGYTGAGLEAGALDALNEEIVIRVNLTNHRTETADLDCLLTETAAPGEIAETRLAAVQAWCRPLHFKPVLRRSSGPCH